MAKKPEPKKRQSKRSHRRNSRPTCSRVSGDRCGDAVGFSLSTRRQCNGRRQAERDRQKIAAIPASASILPRSWHWGRAAPPTVAARTRIVSAAGIRLDHRKTARPFKRIFCDDISEFESSHPSHAVRSPLLFLGRPPKSANLHRGQSNCSGAGYITADCSRPTPHKSTCRPEAGHTFRYRQG
jgi:hypothetical protein